MVDESLVQPSIRLDKSQIVADWTMFQGQCTRSELVRMYPFGNHPNSDECKEEIENEYRSG